jgi:hypothetical protein
MSESPQIPRAKARRCVRHHYDASKKRPSHHIATTGFFGNKGAPRPKAQESTSD